MIHDVDESLRALVKRDALNGSGVDVAFDAPTKDWVARRNAPVVNLYLYDIREDLTRRETAWMDVRGGDGRVMERRLPPRRYRLSYLATAWTSRPEDEHRLLSSLLAAFVQHEFFPPDLLQGALQGEETPVLITVALPPADERKIADTWSALGGELKPSLDVVVTAPLSIARSLEAGPPVLEEPRLAVVRRDDGTNGNGHGSRDGNGHTETARRRNVGAAPAAAVPATEAVLPEAEGTRAPATVTTEGATADETFTVGRKSAPGRRIRVRYLPR
ncbi:MAG TPA: DUF4255 domain-containing protein [Candidatus Limnocylindrales bacterium]|nr:DUF4255 domain-containing protein [Candidatus Limnocylindrales bacterium]